MKILYISPRYEGGIGGHALRVAEKLRQHGFDIKLMHVPHIPVKNIKNPSFAIFGAAKAALDRERYDVVHAWNVPSAVVMRFIKAKKKVLSVHGVYSEQVDALHSGATSSVVSATEEKLLKIADILTTDSKLVQKSYKEKLGLDFVYLPAPLDTDRFREIPDLPKKPNQVVYIGRDSPEKGIDVLKKIEDKINGNVIYCTDLPWQETMARLKESAVLAVPSRMESLPQVIKEAFYLKVPVVATNVGDIPDIVQNDVTGMLVEPDNPEQLLNSINIMLGDSKKSKRCADAAYDFIMEIFTWDVLLQKYIDFYKNLA